MVYNGSRICCLVVSLKGSKLWAQILRVVDDRIVVGLGSAMLTV